MDTKEILKSAEESLVKGNNKAKSYSELTQVTSKYEQMYNEYESEKKKVNELTIRNKDLKQVNDNLIVKILNDNSNSSTKQPQNNQSGMDSFLDNLKY